MGTGTFYEEGGVGKKEFSAAGIFLLCPPIFQFAHPGFSILGGQKRILAHDVNLFP